MPSKFRSVNSLYTIFPSWRTKKSRILASFANRKFYLVQTYVGKLWSVAERFWCHHVLQCLILLTQDSDCFVNIPCLMVLVSRKILDFSLSTPPKQKAHEVEWSCAFAEYGQLRNASGGTRTLNAIKTSASEADTSANSVTLAKSRWNERLELTSGALPTDGFLRPRSLPISARPQKSVKYYGTSRFDTDLQPIVGDPSSTNGPTARSENSRCSPSTQHLSAVSEKCYVQDSNPILSTEGATHSCEHLHHLTDGHSKMIVYLY